MLDRQLRKKTRLQVLWGSRAPPLHCPQGGCPGVPAQRPILSAGHWGDLPSPHPKSSLPARRMTSAPAPAPGKGCQGSEWGEGHRAGCPELGGEASSRHGLFGALVRGTPELLGQESCLLAPQLPCLGGPMWSGNCPPSGGQRGRRGSSGGPLCPYLKELGQSYTAGGSPHGAGG